MKQREIFGQPAGVILVAGTEFWERFSFYGLMGLLALYLTAPMDRGGMGWENTAAIKMVGAYAGLVLMSPILGGIVATRWWGERRCIAVGAVLIMAGHIVLGLQAFVSDQPELATNVLYLALGLIVVGTGLLKPTISSIVGKLYVDEPEKRDAGFTVFMVCIWAGSLSSNFVAGTVGELLGWHYGFSVAAFGMAVGLGCYGLFSRSLLGNIGLVPEGKLDHGEVTSGAATTFRPRIDVIAIFSCFTIVYAVCFYQKSGLLNLITQQNTDRVIGSFEIPATWFLSISTAVFICVAPFFGKLWTKLARKGSNPNVLTKQSFALLLMALAYVILASSALIREQDPGILTSLWFIVGVYILFGLADIFIWPIQISAVSALAPQNRVNLFISLWWVAAGVGTYLTGYVASLANVYGQSTLFFGIAAVCAMAAALLVVLGRITLPAQHEAPIDA